MAIISFSSIFNLAQTTKQFHFTDTSDYDGQGLGLNDMFGAFRIIAPSGNTIYNKGVPSTSNFDIRNATSRNSVGTISIPISSGIPEQGLYTIIYTVWDDASSVYYTVTETFNFIYASPTLTINGTVAVYTPSPLITLQDTTVYQVNSIDPSISRVATISYEAMFVNGVLTTPTPTVGSTNITTSNYFFSPTTEFLSVASNLTYVYAGTGTNTGFTVLDYVYGGQSLKVDATSYCGTVCGLNEMSVRHLANPQDAVLANDFSLAMAYWTLIQANQTCGKPDNISGWIKDIQSLGSFDSSCNCCSDEFTQVVGLGGLISAYDIISANSYIGVSSNSSGGTKTYTLTLSQAFVDLVTAQGVDISTLQGQVITINTTLTSLQNQINILLAKEVTIISSDSTVDVEQTDTCVGALLNTAGTGYVAGNTLTASGGTGTAVQIVVDTVNISGNILTFHKSVSGSYSVLPSNPVTFTGGAGSGAKFNLEWTEAFDLSVPINVQNATSTRTASALAITSEANYQVFGTLEVVPQDGYYFLFFEADILCANNQVVAASYYPAINGSTVNISVFGSADARDFVRVAGSGATTISNKLSMGCPVQLTQGQEVNIRFNTTGLGATVASIDKAFLQLIRFRD